MDPQSATMVVPFQNWGVPKFKKVSYENLSNKIFEYIFFYNHLNVVLKLKQSLKTEHLLNIELNIETKSSIEHWILVLNVKLGLEYWIRYWPLNKVYNIKHWHWILNVVLNILSFNFESIWLNIEFSLNVSFVEYCYNWIAILYKDFSCLLRPDDRKSRAMSSVT